MTFVKLTSTNGEPLLLKYELIESVRGYRKCQYDLDGKSIIQEHKTTIRLTNGNEFDVKGPVEKVEKILGGKVDEDD